jgi:hypothetical protein
MVITPGTDLMFAFLEGAEVLGAPLGGFFRIDFQDFFDQLLVPYFRLLDCEAHFALLNVI